MAALAGCATVAKEPPLPFSIDGQPIPAVAVMLLEGELPDPFPIYKAVDVRAVMEANQFHDWRAYIRENGAVGCRVPVPAEDDFEQFEYQHLGCTSHGTHILRTTLATTGTLVVTSLHFVQVRRQQRWEDGNWRSQIVLQSIGDFMLGDRDDGDIRVIGDKVIVGASKHRPEVTEIDVP